MCGRFAQYNTKEKIVDALNVDDIADFVPEPSYNIAPNAWVPAIVKYERYKLGALRWGLLPSWAKDESLAHKMINARSETCHEKPAFRVAFKKRRCAVVCNGYFEWKKSHQGKQPFYILPSNKPVNVFAGLYEIWKNPQGEKIPTCTILTTEAIEPMREIYDRMPVFLTGDTYEKWLNPGVLSEEEIKYVFNANQSLKFECYPVSPKMNSPRFNAPECVEPI